MYFSLSPEGKAIQALVGADGGKDGFSHREAVRVNLAPQCAIHCAGHPPGKVGEFYPDGHSEMPAFAASRRQTPQLQGTTLTIVLLGPIYSPHQTVGIGFFGYPPQSFSLGAQVVIAGLLVGKILSGKPLPPGPVPSLCGIAGIPPAEIDVRDISIQAQLLAFAQIGVAVIVGVGGEDFSRTVLLTVPQALEILQSPVQQGRPMGMILTPAEGLGMHDDLVLAGDEGLAVVALDDPMGRFHLGRVVVREVAADLLARGPVLALILLEPSLYPLGLLQQALHLALPVSDASRTPGGIVSVILLNVLGQQFPHLGFEPFLLPVQLGPGAAPLFGGIGGQLEPVQGKEGPAQKVHLLTD
jgi:hypothetical protein